MHVFRTIAAAAVMATLAAGVATAQGKGQAKGEGNRAEKPARAQPAKRTDREVETRRAQQPRSEPREARKQGGAIGHTAAPPKGGTPPGHGGTPPGQAKKMYRTDDGLWVLRDVLRDRGYTVTRLSRSNDYRYVYYRLPDGTVRRAVVQPGTERLQFVNVPAVVLREVISRLY